MADTDITAELEPTFNEQEWSLDIKQQLITAFAAAVQAVKGVIESRTKDILRIALEQSDHYNSLINGRLRREFGLEDAQEQVKTVVDALLGSVGSQYGGPNGVDNLGSITIYASKNDYTDVLSAAGATYVSRSIKRGTEIEVPWLRWLLFEGDNLIISDFRLLDDGRVRASSRTQSAIMIPGKSALRLNAPLGYRVSPEYAGVANDNWILNTITQDNVYNQLEDIVREEITAAWGG